MVLLRMGLVYSESDRNGMLTGWMILLLVFTSSGSGRVLDLSNGTFHREGTAYYSNDSLTMQSYSVNVPRTDTCNASDGTMIYGEVDLSDLSQLSQYWLNLCNELN